MEIIYYWIGFTVFWASSVGILGYIFQWSFKRLLNLLGNQFLNFWIVVEYGIHRKKFKEYIKDKKRHPKIEKRNNPTVLPEDYCFSDENGDEVHVILVLGDKCIVSKWNAEKPYSLPLEFVESIYNDTLDEENNNLNNV